MASASDFPAVFTALRAIFEPYASRLKVTADEPTKYSLSVGYIPKFKKEVWLGGVEIMKNYVSFHLMPIYMNPKLQATISPALKARMQGKACFNFKTVDPDLFAELADLTARGVACFKNEFSQSN